MRIRVLAYRVVVVLLFVVGGVASPVGAAQYDGDARVFTQPGGEQVEVRLYGTEFYLRATSTDGYTVMPDPVSGRIAYAQPGAGGVLVPSAVAYRGPADPGLISTLAAMGIEPGLRLDSSLVQSLVQTTKQQLWKGEVAPSVATASGSTMHAPVGGYTQRLGTGKGLVVLVDFSDRVGSPPTADFDKAFNGDTYDALGSIRSWIETISYKKYSATHQIVGYLRADYPTSHYVGGAEFDYSASAELMKQVYAYIDKEIDLTPLATNGSLPSLVVVYPGAEIAKVWATGLWPHAGEGGYTTSEKVRIPNAFISNAGTGAKLDLDTFRHELGHSLFGWPDTYDYDSDSKGAGGFATETTWPCAPFRLWSGWITVVDTVGQNMLYSLAANGDTCLRYKNAANAKEYFIVEYMKKDSVKRANAPDDGLLVWHVDERGDNSAQDMTATKHYELSVEQADGLFDLEKNKSGRANDLFHAGNKDKFDDTTTPNSKWWNGTASEFRLCNIGALDASINVTVGCTGPITVATGGSAVTDGGIAVGGAVATGGSARTGGSVTGGTVVTGGTLSTGGRTAPRDAGSADVGMSGGTSTTDGSVATGGTMGTGGSPRSGGGVASGGAVNSGGSVATGGTWTGGTVVSGGTIATGSTSAKGGSANSGGNSDTGGAMVTNLTGQSGCSCTVGQAPRKDRPVAMVVLGILGGVVVARVRRKG